VSDQYLGEIRTFPFNFAPQGWALCNGQLLSIAQNTALFSLVGTSFGGNGTTTFGLPNLQGSFAMHWGQGVGLSPYVIGQAGGEANVTLLSTQMPSHNHLVNCTATDGTASPAETVAGQPVAQFGGGGRGRQPAYAAGPATVSMSASAVTQAGGSQPHNNMPPYLTVNFCIALVGIFPPRS
jgi:microcystin-dependent protein